VCIHSFLLKNKSGQSILKNYRFAVDKCVLTDVATVKSVTGETPESSRLVLSN
jgi:hypothetical protein